MVLPMHLTKIPVCFSRNRVSLEENYSSTIVGFSRLTIWLKHCLDEALEGNHM